VPAPAGAKRPCSAAVLPWACMVAAGKLVACDLDWLGRPVNESVRRLLATGTPHRREKAATAQPPFRTGRASRKGRRGVGSSRRAKNEIMRQGHRIVATVLRELLETALPAWTPPTWTVSEKRGIARLGATPAQGLSTASRPASAPASTTRWCHAYPSSKQVHPRGDLLKSTRAPTNEGYHADQLRVRLRG